jgi:uncharacterized protein
MSARPEQLRGQTALVTGASSGLGLDFARELAARGADLVLVARRAALLRDHGDDLAARHGVKVTTFPMSLAERDGPQRLYDGLRDAGIAIDILVNNAGSGVYGRFADGEWERECAMLDIDIFALVHLTKLFVRDMQARNCGHILQVASIAAYQPTPLYACYGGAKAFVLSFGEALSCELRNTGVSCTVLSPGVVETEFFRVAGQTLTRYQRLTAMPGATVARIGVNAMLKRKSSAIPGLANRLGAFLPRMLPRRASAALAQWTVK